METATLFLYTYGWFASEEQLLVLAAFVDLINNNAWFGNFPQTKHKIAGIRVLPRHADYLHVKG